MIELSDIQFEFLQDVASLILKSKAMGFKITGGELFRTREQQQIYLSQGKSKIMNSYHLKRLAIDLNFFTKNENGNWRLTYRKEAIQEMGDYWESLNSQNKWGGNWRFKDTNHFQRNL